jgi:hypothetical protein
LAAMFCEGWLVGQSHWWQPLHAWCPTLPDAMIQRNTTDHVESEGEMLDAVIPAWLAAEQCGAPSDWFQDPFFRVGRSIPYPPLACTLPINRQPTTDSVRRLVSEEQRRGANLSLTCWGALTWPHSCLASVYGESQCWKTVSTRYSGVSSYRTYIAQT